MATDGPKDCVLDASVLINFLRVDRQNWFGRSSVRFLVTEHVDREISFHYVEQRTRFETAIATGSIKLISVTDLPEVELFAQLTSDRRLGNGECAALAVGIARAIPVAIDDTTASRVVKERFSEISLWSTADVVRLFIRQGVVTVHDADLLKHEWETNHRFRLPFDTFGEK